MDLVETKIALKISLKSLKRYMLGRVRSALFVSMVAAQKY